MSLRNELYKFVSTESAGILSGLISKYEEITKHTLQPADPERLFIAWVASVIIQERVITNYVGNQNIPSRAEGKNLDALGELFYDSHRPLAQAAKCTIRFTIVQPLETAILIPAGTRITDRSSNLVWCTVHDTYIQIGNTSVDVAAICETVGTIGNGYAAGQINKLIDVDSIPYLVSCENIDLSVGGTEEASDEEYYNNMRASMDAYSCAGAKGAYAYYARKASSEITDVVVNTPAPGEVNIYAVVGSGEIAGEEIKSAILEACSEDIVRPLTDKVSVKDVETISYDIDLKYYVPLNSAYSYKEIEDSVNTAVEKYIEWQCSKIGRDINPSELYGLIMNTGVKRIELISPQFMKLRDGKDNTIPQIAKLRNISVVSGGNEDE